MPHYFLKLFVSGRTRRSKRAIANLRCICESGLIGNYKIMVIDVLEQPELAEAEMILATPTLIKVLPPPIRQIIGDLSDTKRVLLGLDLKPDEQADTA